MNSYDASSCEKSINHDNDNSGIRLQLLIIIKQDGSISGYIPERIGKITFFTK